MNYKKLLVLPLVIVGLSCQERASLPILGPKTTDASGEVIEHSIPDFSFINQDGDTITQSAFNGKIYVADFFFTSCPTICPVMESQMLRVYEHFKDNPAVGMISHSIDPSHDSVEVLKNYSSDLGVIGTQWQFVTGDQDQIYDIAAKGYMVSAMEDSTDIESGGFIHSGAFLLIDKNKHVRGQYDGTQEDEVNQLIRDIELLLKEEN